VIQYDMLLEQLRRSWYGSSPAYARVAITMTPVAMASSVTILQAYDAD
jgi:hypothetical protein